MSPDTLLDFLHVVEKLKCNTRHSWTSTGRHETVAAHSWRLALMAYLLRDSLTEVDMDKVLRMCLIHDFGEALTGDIPSFEKTAAHEAEERQAVTQVLAPLPEGLRAEMTALFAEMDALESTEAKVWRALDMLEVVVQHNEAPLDTWTQLEHTLNLTYGQDEAQAHPILSVLRAAAQRDALRKLAQGVDATPQP